MILVSRTITKKQKELCLCYYKNAKKVYMNVMKLILSCSALVLSVFSIIIDKANAQGSAGSMAMFPRMNIVDMPSARVIPVEATEHMV